MLLPECVLLASTFDMGEISWKLWSEDLFWWFPLKSGGVDVLEDNFIFTERIFPCHRIHRN